MIRITCYIKKEQREMLKHLSKAQDKPMGEIMRAAIDVGLEKLIKKGDAEMTNQAKNYENIGDNLKGCHAIAAYRAAQNHLNPQNKGAYLDDVKRLQDKILASMENEGGGEDEKN